MKKTFILLLFCLEIISLCAQSNFKLFLGGAFPLGKFADSFIEENEFGLMYKTSEGGAGNGINFGFQYDYAFNGVEGLYCMVEADFFFSFLNRDLRDWKEECLIDNESIDDYFITLPKYINIPLMVGFGYKNGLKDNVDIYADFALGLNIQKVTSFYEYGFDEGSEFHYGANSHFTDEVITEYNYYPSNSFAFKTNVGLLINNHYDISIGYWNLGSNRIKGKINYNHTHDCVFDGETIDSDHRSFRLRSITAQIIGVRMGLLF